MTESTELHVLLRNVTIRRDPDHPGRVAIYVHVPRLDPHGPGPDALPVQLREPEKADG